MLISGQRVVVDGQELEQVVVVGDHGCRWLFRQLGNHRSQLEAAGVILVLALHRAHRKVLLPAARSVAVQRVDH